MDENFLVLRKKSDQRFLACISFTHKTPQEADLALGRSVANTEELVRFVSDGADIPKGFLTDYKVTVSGSTPTWTKVGNRTDTQLAKIAAQKSNRDAAKAKLKSSGSLSDDELTALFG